MTPRTLVDKVWDAHLVDPESEGDAYRLYVDLHLVHEVTSPQAFEQLRMDGRSVRRPDLTVATADHNVPTEHIDEPVRDPISARQLKVLQQNCLESGILYYPMGADHQGIVHVIGPELGLTLPGMTVVCGDSHTATHGAFGALAFGIGTSEVAHVLATQTLVQTRPRTMAVEVKGDLPRGVSPKDLILAIIGEIGTGGGIGYAIEYRGAAIEALSMEGRMTVCNMSIEAGARAGVIAPDDTTYEYVQGRKFAPSGSQWDDALDWWHTLPTDDGAVFDRSVTIDASQLSPQVTWGTNPGQVVGIDGTVPDPRDFPAGILRDSAVRALDYMGLEPGIAIQEIPVDTVFIGSCTNARIEDLRIAAHVIAGNKIAHGTRGLVVPGSREVRRQAELEGLNKVFVQAGFEWREPGCSMCLGMNPDQLSVGERAASTSNRNFEGRQGRGGRTHLVSPAVAAATAIAGHFARPDEIGDDLAGSF